MNQWRYWAATKAVGGHRLTSRGSARIGNAQLRSRRSRHPLAQHKTCWRHKTLERLSLGAGRAGGNRTHARQATTILRISAGALSIELKDPSWKGRPGQIPSHSYTPGSETRRCRQEAPKNCLRSCVRLFLRAGGWASRLQARKRQKLPTELR